MDALEAIRSRRSIRKYLPRPVPDELIRTVLAAAMNAPSAANRQPWHFLVLTDRPLLERIPAINPHADMAKDAPAAILVCGDTTLELAPGYAVVDCAAAVENLLLAAHAVGLGAVWTGIWPREERMAGFRQLFGLPEHLVPHSLVPLGYPAEYPGIESRYRDDRVHYNRWP